MQILVLSNCKSLQQCRYCWRPLLASIVALVKCREYITTVHGVHTISLALLWFWSTRGTPPPLTSEVSLSGLHSLTPQSLAADFLNSLYLNTKSPPFTAEFVHITFNKEYKIPFHFKLSCL